MCYYLKQSGHYQKWVPAIHSQSHRFENGLLRCVNPHTLLLITYQSLVTGWPLIRKTFISKGSGSSYNRCHFFRQVP